MAITQKGTIYLVGYQPLEIVDRRYLIVDLLHTVMEKNPPGKVKDAIIDLAKNFVVTPGDFLLLNTVRNKDLIPYFQAQNPLLYDPPYVASERDIYKILQGLMSIVGTPEHVGLYVDLLNSMRTTILLGKGNMSQAEYYNCLLLLSDLNQSNTEAVDNFIASKRTPFEIPNVRKKVIFVGDPVQPEYFNQLNKQGIAVMDFVPYEFFMNPCDRIDTYYFDNPLFQQSLYMLVELRRLVSQHQPDAIIFNPGGLYLTNEEADYFIYALQKDLPVYKLPGTYIAPPIQI